MNRSANPSLTGHALRIAVQAHAGQRRKADNRPFIEHPLAVAAILIQHDCDDRTVAAGLLHDVLEDTPWTATDLKRALSDAGDDAFATVSIVEECSEPDKTLPWRTRKERFIQTMPHKQPAALRVIAADKLHNLRNLRQQLDVSPRQTWKAFRAGPDEQAWYHNSILRNLRTALAKHDIRAGDANLLHDLAAATSRIFPHTEHARQISAATGRSQPKAC